MGEVQASLDDVARDVHHRATGRKSMTLDDESGVVGSDVELSEHDAGRLGNEPTGERVAGQIFLLAERAERVAKYLAPDDPGHRAGLTCLHVVQFEVSHRVEIDGP